VALEARKYRSEYPQVGALEDAKDVEAVLGRPTPQLQFTLGQLVAFERIPSTLLRVLSASGLPCRLPPAFIAAFSP
jgi:hypothetical protein